MFEIGDLVWYRGRWGQAPPVAAIITGSGGKDGTAVFDCQREDAQDWGAAWGYEYQFESRACHLCGSATAEPSCPLCPGCAGEMDDLEMREQDARAEKEQRRRQQ